MRHFTLLLTVVLSVYAGDKKPKRPKAEYVRVSGVIASKTEIAGGIWTIDFKAGDDTYVCFQKEYDPRFRRFQAGDKIGVSGDKRPDSKVIDYCHVDLWTSTGAIN